MKSINSGMSTVLTSLMVRLFWLHSNRSPMFDATSQASRLVLHLHTSTASNQSASHPRTPLPPHPSNFAPMKPPVPPRAPPLASFSLQEGEEMPMAVRVALRGIGNDEHELGIKDQEELREDRRARAGAHGQSLSGIRVDREMIVQVDEESEVGLSKNARDCRT